MSKRGVSTLYSKANYQCTGYSKKLTQSYDVVVLNLTMEEYVV